MSEERILNSEQLEAVKHEEGPLLIIAGAGTGKTTVVTQRIKYLILEKKISPINILALTFTEKAAQEMEERIDQTMPYGYTQMWISTFHAFCDRILRNEAIHIGLNPSYKLFTEAENVLFLRQNLFKFKLEYFRPLGNPNKFIMGMLQHFSRLKDEDVSPDEYLLYAKKLNAKRYTLNADKDEIRKNLELADAYKTYEELKIKEGFMDFSGLISNTLKLFRERTNILKNYQEQFKYILVDEFQDTNFAQNTLAILLAGQKQNITVVGDDDQAIYRWRGAAISNMIQFRKHFPNVKIITLTKNYRSTEEILNSSYALIQNNNPDRLEIKEKVIKKLTSMRKIKGKPIEFIFTERVEDEAETVVKKIQELKANNYQYKDFAILVRANDYAQAFVRTLIRFNIPYQFLGPGQLFQREEIKDLISYLKVLYNFEDSTSFYRVLALQIFELDALEIAALLNFARRKNFTLFEALEILDNPENSENIFLKDNAKEKLKNILKMIKKHLKLVPKETAGQILYYFLEDSGLLKKMLLTKSETDEKKFQNIAKFFDKLKTYEAEHEKADVFAVVDWIDLSMQMGESPLAANTDWSENNAVNILTIHSSKGLEFPVVFLVNLVNQRFPTRERHEQIPIPQELIKEILPIGDFHLQEERRLFYVGMTRARDSLFLTAANFYGEGKRERKISPFVYETLGEQDVLKITDKQKIKKIIIQPSLLDWAQEKNKKEISIVTPINNTSKYQLNYISYSQIQTFEICPLHYKLKYILKIPTPQVAAQSFGISIHNALRDFYRNFLNDEKTKTDTILQILDTVWINEGYTSKTHEQEARQHAKKILTEYVKNNFDPKKLKSQPIALETPFNFYVNKIKIGGRIDRVDKTNDNKIEIIDYKTSDNIPDEKEVAKNLQLTIYALAATQIQDKIFNKKPEEILLTLHFLSNDKKLTTTRTKEQLKQVKEYIMQKVQEISTSDFACSKSTFCHECEYKMLCSTTA
ncbi:MAG: ATP-dependent helicase [Candidatus Levybacteria bacterium]|nr:ATP-dependent helicase [Candidatus Levybacteria bacterium]